MDTVFWTGIGIGFVLSVIASLIANLYIEQLRGWLERRRQARTLRALGYEKRIYNLVKKLRSEPAFAIVFAMQGIGLLVLMTGMVTWSLALIIVTRVIRGDDAGSRFMNWPFDPTSDRVHTLILGSFGFFICVGLALMLARRFALLYDCMKDFSEYRDKLVEKWPNEDWSE
jgi:hypothetical protein